jgi:hypothetical protein
MADYNSTLSISLSPGMYIDLKIPILDGTTSPYPNGLYPRSGYIKMGNKQRPLLKGFIVEKEEVGYLLEVDAKFLEDQPVQVKYVHVQPLPNRIFFYGMMDINCVVNIVSIPVHDHSTIYTGGPAHGTYYSNYKQENK